MADLPDPPAAASPAGAFQNLRTVTLTVLLIAFALFAVGQWLSARWLYDGSFENAEQHYALAQARHAQAIVANPLDFLRRTAIDNAMWDEAYGYMRGTNPRHPDNLLPMTDSFRMLRLSAYGFVSLDGRVVFARQFDPRREHLMPASEEIIRALGSGGAVGRHYRIDRDISGYSHIGGGIYGWSAAPILRSDGSGPAAGWWVLLSELDAAFLDATSQAIGARAVLAVRPMGDRQNVVAHTPLDGKDVQMAVVDDAWRTVRFPLGMLDEASVLELVVTNPREIHATALRASQYLLWTTLLFGTLLSALALWFVERRLLRPLAAASKGLVRIGHSGDLSARLPPAPRQDEIGRLVLATNQMLGELEIKRNVAAAMLSAIPDTLLRIDAHGVLLEVRVPEEARAGGPWPVPGEPLARGYPSEAAGRLLEALVRARASGVNQHVEYCLPREGEPPRYFEARITMITASEALGLLRDITERKEAEGRIARLAYFDALTGLPNRTAFMERLAREVRRARRNGHQLGLLFLDLDGFKEINDTLGHNRGDQVLLWTAERLRETLRPSDTLSHASTPAAENTLARLGGDEFTMLISDINGPEDVLAVAHRIGMRMRDPFELDGRAFTLTSSIGIAVYPDDGPDAQTLLKHADTAMYHAKKLGRDNSQRYSAALTEQAMSRLDLDNALRVALSRGEFRLLYQPVVNLATGKLIAVESLIRWQHPVRGLISPMLFIPLAEENGLISAIGEWVLETACEDLARWQRGGLDLRLAVNISPRQFSRPDLVRSVLDTLARAGVSPCSLELEITEGAVMEKFVATIAALHAFREHGIRIALDDFGTGYSSLSYLMQIPMDVLKVDRSFVGRLDEGGRGASIVQAILALARTLGLSVTAEGVETFAQALALKQMDCQNVQGFYFSRPVAAAQVPALVAQVWTVDKPGQKIAGEDQPLAIDSDARGMR